MSFISKITGKGKKGPGEDSLGKPYDDASDDLPLPGPDATISLETQHLGDGANRFRTAEEAHLPGGDGRVLEKLFR